MKKIIAIVLVVAFVLTGVGSVFASDTENAYGTFQRPALRSKTAEMRS